MAPLIRALRRRGGPSWGGGFLVTPSTIVVTPDTLDLEPAATQQLTAVVRNASSQIVVPAFVEYTTSNPAVATVSATGLVTAIGAGTATITGTIRGTLIADTVAVEVGGGVDPDLGLLFRGIDNTYASDAAFQAAVIAGTSPWDAAISDTKSNVVLDPAVLYEGHPTIKFSADGAGPLGYLVGSLGSSPVRRWIIEAVRFSPTLGTTPIADGVAIGIGAELSNTWAEYDRWLNTLLTTAPSNQFVGSSKVVGTSGVPSLDAAPAFDQPLTTLRGQWIVLPRLVEYSAGAGTLRLRTFANGTPITDVTKAEADLGALVGMGDLMNVYALVTGPLFGPSDPPELRPVDPTNDYVHFGRIDVYDADVNADPAGVL